MTATQDAPSQSIIDDGLISVRDAAKFASLGKSTVYDLMDEGRLAFVQIGRARRIPRAALMRFLDKNLHGAAQ